MRGSKLLSTLFVAWVVAALPCEAGADAFTFSTGNPDGKMASAARPETAAKFEIESGDDFFLNHQTQINHATFTGLLTGANPTVSQVVVEIYRVFSKDSDVGRTSGAPDFSTPNVPTRVNSPSDVAFEQRDSAVGELTFNVTSPGSFTAGNSVQPGGIHAKPNQTTGGDGPVTGTEVVFDVTLTNPFTLPADHYFFVPQVDVSGGEFLWLSAPKPIVAPGTPFLPDLQSWTRDDATIAPDWLRIGTDIVGKGTADVAPTFNAVFSLAGETVPEPSSLTLLGFGVAGLGGLTWRRTHRLR